MPGSKKYGTTKAIGNNSKREALMSKLFKNSPLYDGSYTPDLVDALANQVLVPPVQQGDTNIFPVGVSMVFGNAPNLGDVKTGGGGLSATPFTPNTLSAGPAAGSMTGDSSGDPKINIDPAQLPDPGDPNTTLGDIGRANVAGPDIQKNSVLIGQTVVLDPTKETLVEGGVDEASAPKDN